MCTRLVWFPRRSVERLATYRDDLPRETEEKADAAPALWPEHGAISFEAVSCRYREDLPVVLKDVTVAIPARAKAGIVGRTGSGKSSFLLALPRLNLVSAGRVIVDGVDAGAVPLDALRGAVAMIPQEPVLFQGSARFNLDPFAARSDAECEKALEAAGLPAADLSRSVGENGAGAARTFRAIFAAPSRPRDDSPLDPVLCLGPRDPRLDDSRRRPPRPPS